MRRRWVFVGIVAAGAVMSGLLALRAYGLGREMHERYLGAHLKTLQQQLEGELEDTEAELRAFSEYFTQRGEIKGDDFSRLASSSLRSEEAFETFGWYPLVRGEYRTWFEQEAHSLGMEGFAVVEPDGLGSYRRAARRPEYAPLLYHVGRRGEPRQYGVDLLAEGRLGPSLRSLRGGDGLFSRVMDLPHLGLPEAGAPWLMLALPVRYRAGEAGVPAEDFRGYVVGVLSTQGIFSRMKRELSANGLCCRLLGSDGVELFRGAGSDWEQAGGVEARVLTGGLNWRVQVAPGAGFALPGYPGLPRAILAGGLVITALVGFYVNANLRFRDESRRGARRLNLAVGHSQQAVRAKSEFLANLSHEVRTPLNAVMGSADLLNYTPLSGEQQAYVRRLEQGGELLLQIINDVLELSKIEAGRVDPQEETFELKSQLRDTVQLMEGKAAAKKLPLRVEFEGTLPEYVRTDRLRFRQILVNLLSNAVKFTDEGTVVLRASREALAEPYYRCRFTVEDTGIGIPGDKLEEVFEPFKQADAAVARRYGGTGLGLAISRSLARALGGSLTGRSEPGVGSEFTFEVEMKGESQGGQQAGLQEQPQGRAEPLPECRILLAEDEPFNQQVLKAQLGKLGYHCDLAENGLEALQAVRARSYDVVLMDVMMPEMDGITATREIRNLPERGDTRIIAVTARAFADDQKRCLEAGMDDFLTKPVSLSQLGEMVKKHC